MPLQRRQSEGIGAAAVTTLAFALFAPIGLVALPFAALTVVSRTRRRRAIWIGAFAAAVAALWLAAPGSLATQTIRAAAVLGTAVFAAAALTTGWSTTHRALVAGATAVAGVIALFGAYGWSWDRLHWWVEREQSFAMRAAMGVLFAGAGDASRSGMLAQLEAAVGSVVRLAADYFPATVVLEMLVGFWLASILHARLTGDDSLPKPGRFRDFRFSEHLGWAAAIPLLVVLVPRFAAARLAAANVLVVMGALYATRGLAVTAVGLGAVGEGWMLYLLGALAIIFMLPVVGGAMILGVLDTGLDFRRRWTAPTSGD